MSLKLGDVADCRPFLGLCERHKWLANDRPDVDREAVHIDPLST